MKLPILSALGLLLHVATNPTTDDFGAAMRDAAVKTPGDALVALIAVPILKAVTVRDKFVILSVFRANIGNIHPIVALDILMGIIVHPTG